MTFISESGIIGFMVFSSFALFWLRLSHIFSALKPCLISGFIGLLLGVLVGMLVDERIQNRRQKKEKKDHITTGSTADRD